MCMPPDTMLAASLGSMAEAASTPTFGWNVHSCRSFSDSALYIALFLAALALGAVCARRRHTVADGHMPRDFSDIAGVNVSPSTSLSACCSWAACVCCLRCSRLASPSMYKYCIGHTPYQHGNQSHTRLTSNVAAGRIIATWL